MAAYAVFAGLDVGKQSHHLVALDDSGKRLADRCVGNDEAQLRDALAGLVAHADGEPARVLVVVDQPASIGALPVALARDIGATVAYLPGLAMRRLADLHPGQAKTDARDAYVIADAARTLPHTLRSAGTDVLAEAELAVLVGTDDDLAAETTRLSNRLRDALLACSPALERALGPRISHPAVLEVLRRWPTPDALRRAGRAQLRRVMRTRAPRMGERLVDDIWAAVTAQTVVLPGTAAYAHVIPAVADSLARACDQRDAVATRIDERLDDHPLAKVLTSMPGVGVRTAARLLVVIGDASAFPTAAHLASYAGLAPVTRRFGTSIKGEIRSMRGHRALKSALFLSAFASLSDPASRAYYDRKRAAGRRHNAALICLARRRVDVLHAMLRTRTPYRPGGRQQVADQTEVAAAA